MADASAEPASWVSRNRCWMARPESIAIAAPAGKAMLFSESTGGVKHLMF